MKCTTIQLNGIAFHKKHISKLQSITCHMGSHNVTCHLPPNSQSKKKQYLIDIPQKI